MANAEKMKSPEFYFPATENRTASLLITGWRY